MLQRKKNIPFLLLTSVAFFIITIHCKLGFNNPADPASLAFFKTNLVSTYLKSLIPQEIALVDAEVPQFLALLYQKPGEVGIKVWNVDPNSGQLTSTIGMQAIPPNAPGNAPVILVRIPKTRELLSSSGGGVPTSFNNIYTYQIQDNGSVSVVGTSPEPLPNYITVNKAGSTNNVYISRGASQVFLYTKDKSTHILTQSPSVSYPFGTYCGPNSIVVNPTEKNIFVTNTAFAPVSLSIYNQDPSSGTVTIGSGSPLTLPASPTSNDNINLHPTKNYVYTTIANIAGPIIGFAYNQDSTATAIPGSPFTPSSSYSATNVSTRTLTIDPYGRFIAFVYSDASGNRLQLLKIDSSTGALTPTGFPIGVGNAPNSLTWDESGRFIYFLSNTGGSTNQQQLEIYKVSSTGELTPSPSSPTTLGAMGAFVPSGLASVTKTMKVKPGEYP